MRLDLKITRETSVDATDGNQEWLDCPGCGSTTLQRVIRSAKIDSTILYKETDLGDIRLHELLQCGGCQDIHYRRSEWAHMDEEADALIQVFPPIGLRARAIPEAHLFPSEVEAAYRETIAAAANELPVLTSVGVRILVEAVCSDREAQGRNLEKKIDDLVIQGVLTPEGAEILHGLRILGNESAHEVAAPRQAQLEAALSVVKHLLLGVYVIPETAKGFPKRNQKRS